MTYVSVQRMPEITTDLLKTRSAWPLGPAGAAELFGAVVASLIGFERTGIGDGLLESGVELRVRIWIVGCRA